MLFGDMVSGGSIGGMMLRSVRGFLLSGHSSLESKIAMLVAQLYHYRVALLPGLHSSQIFNCQWLPGDIDHGHVSTRAQLSSVSKSQEPAKQVPLL